MFKIGDLVTRKKYGNDIIFKIKKIDNNKYYLSGLDIRLIADANEDDLILTTISKKKEKYNKVRNLDIKDFYFIPGIILHIDSDEEYIERSKKYYDDNKIKSYCYKYNESEYHLNIDRLIKKHNPTILVITGHDAYNKKNNKYKNSKYFIETVKKSRKLLNENELAIVAGACQSDFIGIINSGASFASSPSHVNIHALDPAIVASYIALTDKNEKINIEEMLSKTAYGSDGIGGIITNGKMISIYPRKE